MKTLPPALAAACAALATPLFALPAIQHVQVGNVTPVSACICWDVTEAASPGLEIFTDAAATQPVTPPLRIEIQPLDNNRREVSSSFASRQSNRAIQSRMAAKLVGLARVSGLAPNTQYFLRPLALNANGATLASGDPVPVTTAQTSAFVPESRQLIVNLAPMVPTTGNVSGALLILAHSGSPYPLIAVVGDAFAPTVGYFDLSCLLDAAGASNLLPAPGALDLTITWLGLPPLTGYFDPSAVNFTGTANVAAATGSLIVNQGNRPPVFAGYVLSGTTDKPISIQPMKILAHASDPDGDLITLTQVFSPTAQGGSVTLGGTVDYVPPAGYEGTDSFEIEITDAPGAAAHGTITITLAAAPTGMSHNMTDLSLHDGQADLVFRGIPGRSYTIQRSTNMNDWADLTTVVAGADGKILFTDPAPPVPQAYYRTRSN